MVIPVKIFQPNNDVPLSQSSLESYVVQAVFDQRQLSNHNSRNMGNLEKTQSLELDTKSSL